MYNVHYTIVKFDFKFLRALRKLALSIKSPPEIIKKLDNCLNLRKNPYCHILKIVS